MINYQAQLVSLQYFWTINSIITISTSISVWLQTDSAWFMGLPPTTPGCFQLLPPPVEECSCLWPEPRKDEKSSSVTEKTNIKSGVVACMYISHIRINIYKYVDICIYIWYTWFWGGVKCLKQIYNKIVFESISQKIYVWESIFANYHLLGHESSSSIFTNFH